MPKAREKQTEKAAPYLEIPDVQYRDIVEVTKAAFMDPSVSDFNMQGHVLMYDPGDERAPERVYGEAYTSNRVLEFEAEVRNRPNAAACVLETVVAIWSLYSDSTHLSNFGTASIWPLYGWLANLSKYLQLKTSLYSGAPSRLPDAVYDAYLRAYGTHPTKEVLAFLRRDLFQAVLRLILTPELAQAYCCGIEVLCGDNVRRLLFLRFLLHSADYPEKLLIAVIRAMSEYLCPRCNTPQKYFHEMGKKRDMQRRKTNERKDTPERRSLVSRVRSWIFNKGFALKNNNVKEQLAFGAQAPTPSAFSDFLFPLGVNYYSLLTVDLMHEFELGVWKSLFIHLIRMCVYFGPETVHALNRRYRAVPPFGKSTIRRFRNNVSELKKFAARDYEDLLQCAEPVFDRLFPEPYNRITMKLLGAMATWHAYAKMAIHTASTLRSFQKATTDLGDLSRKFVDVTSDLETRELAKESRARARNKERRRARSSTSRGRKDAGADGGDEDESSSKARHWNISTYKFHALGDYPQSIIDVGTTDNYNTEKGEHEHKHIKRFYPRTNRKRVDFQIGRHIRRDDLFRARRLQAKEAGKRKEKGKPTNRLRRSLVLGAIADEPLPRVNPGERYQMSRSTRYCENLTTWLSENLGDPAVAGWSEKLDYHILSRMFGGDPETDFDDNDRADIHIVNNCIYKHKTVRFVYTTYDRRRRIDSCNPRTQADIMVLNPSDDRAEQPYWFARLIGVFHVNVIYTGNRPATRAVQTFDVLWVRFFGSDDRQKKFGLHVNRMPRIGFEDAHSATAFGFVDPSAVIRAVHLIPAFHDGYNDNGLGKSIGRPRPEVDDPNEPDTDWAYYYVAMYADRDHVMRFRGGGIGHLATREATRELERQNYIPPPDPDDDTDTEEAIVEKEQAAAGGDVEPDVEMDVEESEDEEELEPEPEDLSDSDAGAETDGDDAGDMSTAEDGNLEDDEEMCSDDDY
ncbi:hypothetical protein MKEN_01343700 [Mycena kentingensis (nom. inval.)]|nr:hypothetical protein MKEN_01343700 [Mycena kentingensis (nom. inval.)]